MKLGILSALLLLLPTSAFAHLGHLGEVAGHSHWIALGAAAAAAAIAAALAKSGKSNAPEESASADTKEAEA